MMTASGVSAYGIGLLPTVILQLLLRIAMIRVIATIEVRAGAREEFLKVFRDLVPQVLAEKGCREYAPWVDVPTTIPAQIPARDHTVTIIERWDSLDALEKHLVAPHMLEYRKAVKDLVTRVTLQVLGAG